MRNIIPWDEARKREHARGFAMPFVNAECGAERLALHVSVIQPGQAAHEPHAHEGEEIMFVLEAGEARFGASGSERQRRGPDPGAEIRMGDETQRVGTNTAIFCPPHVLHGIRNAGETPIRYMIIRTT